MYDWKGDRTSSLPIAGTKSPPSLRALVCRFDASLFQLLDYIVQLLLRFIKATEMHQAPRPLAAHFQPSRCVVCQLEHSIEGSEGLRPSFAGSENVATSDEAGDVVRLFVQDDVEQSKSATVMSWCLMMDESDGESGFNAALRSARNVIAGFTAYEVVRTFAAGDRLRQRSRG